MGADHPRQRRDCGIAEPRPPAPSPRAETARFRPAAFAWYISMFAQAIASPAEAGADALCDLRGLVEIGARQHGGEFVAAEPAGLVVAGRMALGVVHALEAVEVEQQQGDHLRFAPRALHGALRATAEGHAIGQAGQRICQRHGVHPERGAAQLERGDHHARQRAQRRRVFRRHLARLLVADAERAERIAVRVHQRHAQVGAQAGLPGDQRVVHEARVVSRILDHQRPALGVEDRMRAEALGARQARQVHPALGAHELRVRLDQRDLRRRHAQQPAGEFRHAAEPILPAVVQRFVCAKRGEARGLVLGDGRGGQGGVSFPSRR